MAQVLYTPVVEQHAGHGGHPGRGWSQHAAAWAHHLRREVWLGRSPRLGICLLADELTEVAGDERRRLRAFYHRLGLTPGEQWVPPGSFEDRNLMWWLPGNIKRYKPRMPIGDPPFIWGRE